LSPSDYSLLFASAFFLSVASNVESVMHTYIALREQSSDA
jgi:hypothetical protein